MESGMSKIDEVMEIKALRRVISAYLKFVFSVFFLLFFVFIIKKFRHSKSVTECVVVIVASVLIECPSLQTSKKTRQKAVFSLSLSLLDLSFQNPLDASFANLSSSSFFLWGW
jgi:uncharacterized membrane protein